MKKIMTLAAVLCCSMSIFGQDVPTDRNRTYRITLNNVQYAHHDEKMSAGDEGAWHPLLLPLLHNHSSFR